MNSFKVGEKLVWVHVNEETGEKIQEFVQIMNLTSARRTQMTGKPYYIVKILRTNEPGQAWADELFRWETI